MCDSDKVTTHPPGQLGILGGGGGGVRAVSRLLDHEAGPGQPQQLGAGVTRLEDGGRGPHVDTTIIGGLHHLDPVLGLTAAAGEAPEAD